ncbi:hypothetical protein DM02DRAFT_719419 [Periconia macrospinosa]|uniref:Uncharacterized protein n=1 Tax=Periconia macrospinosa TaxID=97972 RepID=A0A2V1DJC5_9PLEO|nr:hypothetical protein DM02DRAFT_719419 [Periconia macrospinosa]
MPFSPSTPCQHEILQLEPSPFAALAGYERPDATQREAAKSSVPSNQRKKDDKGKESTTFPAPLVLPHDELNYDPDQEPQSLRDWIDGTHRNIVTEKKRTIYVVGYPKVGEELKGSGIDEWAKPRTGKERGGAGLDGKKRKRGPNVEGAMEPAEEPDVTELIEYLQAFYHGMRVQRLSTELTYYAWNPSETTSRPRGGKTVSKSAAASNLTNGIPSFIALGDGSQKTRIRVRPGPDAVFAAQLNLDDLLDALRAVIPRDAYAILLLVKHDIYETEDDDFCCGRAYGGSRIAVVQTARYHPDLDGSRGERDGYVEQHVWPMNHCRAFVDAVCEAEEDGLGRMKVTKKDIALSEDQNGGIRRAVAAAAATNIRGLDDGVRKAALWTARVAQTVSHELGHCLGMAHCVYYACNMQGTSGMAEDFRCPPYLCPVCEAKLGYARWEYEKERLEALRGFCEGRGREKALMWRALGAWADARLENWS